MKPTTTYLRPPPGYRFRRPWYLRPWFYVPVAILAVLALFMTVFVSSILFDLKAQANTFDLSQLEQMESASVILDRNGKIFGQIYVENRETVPYEKLPPDLINAVIAVEDAKFYEHHGYDLLGIIRAALKNLVAGHVRQGASTITQQLARNSFSLKERTYRRKLLEIFLAKRIEDHFSKQKIMELYLNRIYFGGGLYGAEAAARGYFGKPAREMTLAECATLAGLIKSPNRLSPWNDRDNSREARDYALDRMRDLGFISHEQCAAARARTDRGRKPAKRSRPDLRSRLHPSASDRSGGMGPRNQRRLSHSHHHRRRSAEGRGGFSKSAFGSGRAASRLQSSDLRRVRSFISQSQMQAVKWLNNPRPSTCKAQ